MIIKIVITGPESTGKSWLASQLAQKYNTAWVPEYAREYIDKLNRPYNKADILKIAKRQIENENILLEKADEILFCDTDLTVAKIWSEHVYKSCHEWILKNINKQHYDFYLLCDIDIPWQEDYQREHPHLREYLFGLYKNELENRGVEFEIISGVGQKRLKKAILAIEHYLNLEIK